MIPTSNSSLAYRGPTQLEKCTIWPAKPSRNVGKVVVWTCHGLKKYQEYPKEYHIQSSLTIYNNSCKLYRSLEWKVDLTFKDIEERVDILKSCHMLPTRHVTSTNSHNVPQSCLKVVSKFSRCFADVVPKLSFSYVKVAQKMFLSCFQMVLSLHQGNTGFNTYWNKLEMEYVLNIGNWPPVHLALSPLDVHLSRCASAGPRIALALFTSSIFRNGNVQGFLISAIMSFILPMIDSSFYVLLWWVMFQL